MQKTAIVAAALVWASGAGQAQSSNDKANQSASRAAGEPAQIMRVGYVQRRPDDPRGQIAVCANLAAIKALDARNVGASYAAQDRILDVTFVLCLAGPQTSD